MYICGQNKFRNQEHSKVDSAQTQSILETIYLVNSAESDFWALWEKVVAM